MDVMTLTRSKLSAVLNQTMKHFSSEKTVLLSSLELLCVEHDDIWVIETPVFSSRLRLAAQKYDTSFVALTQMKVPEFVVYTNKPS